MTDNKISLTDIEEAAKIKEFAEMRKKIIDAHKQEQRAIEALLMGFKK